MPSLPHSTFHYLNPIGSVVKIPPKPEPLSTHYSHNSQGRGDFPGGAVVKNPPANAGDMGSIPGPGKSHMPQSN